MPTVYFYRKPALWAGRAANLTVRVTSSSGQHKANSSNNTSGCGCVDLNGVTGPLAFEFSGSLLVEVKAQMSSDARGYNWDSTKFNLETPTDEDVFLIGGIVGWGDYCTISLFPCIMCLNSNYRINKTYQVDRREFISFCGVENLEGLPKLKTEATAGAPVQQKA